ncbi:hypothetical protein, partial [Paraburkholderia sp. RL17-373-BIF-A]|uniref:hypothetical protein n=1 Tax=Paraburkholderia sp. RL17-373-BIF-A TaxID=3031629 RepID=UPI0038BBA288
NAIPSFLDRVRCLCEEGLVARNCRRVSQLHRWDEAFPTDNATLAEALVIIVHFDFDGRTVTS